MKLKARKPFLVKEVGEWKFTFHYKEGSIKDTFLSIISTSGVFNCRVGGNAEMYGFLLGAAINNDTAVLRDYLTRISYVALEWKDTKLASDVNKAINDYFERKQAEAAAKAKAVTETDEIVAQSVMEDLASEQGMSKKELKAKREADKEAMREAISEMDNDNGE